MIASEREGAVRSRLTVVIGAMVAHHWVLGKLKSREILGRKKNQHPECLKSCFILLHLTNEALVFFDLLAMETPSCFEGIES